MLTRTAALVALLVCARVALAQAPAYSLAIAELPAADAAAVVAGERDAAFSAAAGPVLAPDPTRTRWYRVTPAAMWQDAEPPLLVAYAPYGNRVSVLAPPGYAIDTRTIRDAGLDPRWSRHALVFELPHEIGPATPIYVALEPGRRFPARLALETRASFGAGEVRYVRAMTAILTSIGVMCFVIGAFALALRERTLAYLFAAFVFSFVYLGFITGEGYDVPGLDRLGAFGVAAVWVARALGAACLLAFVVRFLAVAAFAPWLDRVLRLAAIGFLVLAAGSMLPFLAPRAWVPPVGNALLFGSSALALVAGVLAWRRGVRAARFFVPAWLPMLALDMLRELQLLGFAQVYPGNEYAQPGATALAAVLFSAGMADRLLAVRRERDVARHEAERDPLTGALNRRAIVARIDAAEAMHGGPGGELALLFVDLDHFKRINDQYGHATGDACLRAVVQIVEAELRRNDALGRFGGEEFVVLLEGADLAHAMSVGERIRAHIEARCKVVAGQPVGLTASIGIADASIARRSSELIAAADRAMYAAKRAGRNTIRNAPETHPAAATA